MKNNSKVLLIIAYLCLLAVLSILGIFSKGRPIFQIYESCRGALDGVIYNSDYYLPNSDLDPAVQEFLRESINAPRQRCVPAGPRLRSNLQATPVSIAIFSTIGLYTFILYATKKIPFKTYE